MIDVDFMDVVYSALNLPLTAVGIALGLAVLLGGNISGMVQASEQLQRSIRNFRLHRVDLRAQQVIFKIDLHVFNPTQTKIPLSNALIDLYGKKGETLSPIANSRPTGPVTILPGSTLIPLTFTAPISEGLVNSVTGGFTNFRVVVKPYIKGRAIEPTTSDINITSQFFLANQIKSLFSGNSLGLVSGQKTNIKPGNEYDRYWSDSPLKGTSTKVASGTTFNTLDAMKAIVMETLPQTAKLAKRLKGNTVDQTLKNIFSFFHDHYQYAEDSVYREEIRTPRRAWADRKAGVDCDCFSVSISSLLTNLGIPHSFRKTKYGGKPNFQHVYVVAHPRPGKDVVLDPVVQAFNKEEKYSEKFDLEIVK